VQFRMQCACQWRESCLVALLLCLGVGLAQARERESGPRPAMRIPVDPLGYRPPGKLYLLARYCSSSLDFLDPTHVLFTFRQPRLLLRAEDSEGLDQVVQAEVLELPDGKVVAQDQWLLHDRERYLWRLADNKVLLRVGTSLYQADDKLQLKTMFASSTALREVELSPDGKLLMMQNDVEKHTPEQHAALARHAALVGANPPAEDVQVRMVRLDEPKLMLNARATQPGDVPATVDGFFTQERLKQDHWNVRFHPYEKPEPTGGDVVAQVDSICEPSEKVLNPQSVLVLSCPRGHGDRFVAAYTLKGQKLWDGRWQSNFTWPSFRVSQQGESVAISWLSVNHPVAPGDSIDDTSVQNQVLSVLDSHTGALRLALLLDPIISAGGNFALSADGNRLAVLNHGAIEVYDLPQPAPAAPSERAAK
jgi:hypothetical protein